MWLVRNRNYSSHRHSGVLTRPKYYFPGKNYPSSTKESTPFIMEWVPEIFRASKLGELSIRFEFYKSEPNVELGREVS